MARAASPVLFWRLALRRDRVLVPMWFAVLVLACYASAAATPALYKSEAARVSAARAINASPGIVALYGPILDVRSTGELAMTKMTVLYSVLVSVMILFIVRRHTRADEESGRAELIGATAVKPHTLLRSTLVYGTAISCTLGLLVASVNAVGGLPLVGSLAFGMAWAGTGTVATGVAGVACQASASPRTCAAIGSGAFGTLFLLRAVGDATSASWLSWLSPYGWNTQLRAYSGTRWWVLALYLASGAVLMLLADLLSRSRDLGAGLLQARPGPAAGSPRLAGASGLGLRIHRPALVTWSLTMFAIGAIFGAITPGFDSFDTADLKEVLSRIGGAGSFREVMVSSIISMFGLIVTCFAVTVIGHAGSDEHAGLSESVLATATSRWRSFATTAAIALGGATLLLLTGGVGIAIGLQGNSSSSFGEVVAAALAQAPAMWLVAALGLICFALRSSWAVLGWAIIVAFATLGQIGELLDLPGFVTSLSPYTHSPTMPLESFRPLPALVMTAATAAALIAGWSIYNSRDIG